MDKTRIKILGTYAATGAAALLGGVPNYMAQNLCFSLILVILILTYILRGFAKADSLEHHHFTFIIRSIWIYSLFASIGIVGASWMVYEKADPSAIDALLAQINSGAIPTMEDLEIAEKNYLDTNMMLILESIILWMLPALLYLVWRVARGSIRAFKNYRILNIYSWL